MTPSTRNALDFLAVYCLGLATIATAATCVPERDRDDRKAGDPCGSDNDCPTLLHCDIEAERLGVCRAFCVDHTDCGVLACDRNLCK